MGFTVFHSCVMPPDDFVSNARIPFDDLKIGSNNDVWVSATQNQGFVPFQVKTIAAPNSREDHLLLMMSKDKLSMTLELLKLISHS